MKRHLFFSLTLLFTLSGFSQDVYFNNYESAPFNSNPANAGWNGQHQIEQNCRNQWPAISGTYVTNQLSYNGGVKNSGVGVVWTRDRGGKGAFKLDEIDLVYAHHHGTGKLQWSFGAKAGYYSKRLEVNKISCWGPMVDSRFETEYDNWIEHPIQSKDEGFDLELGGIVHLLDYKVGWAVDHVFEPRQQLIRNQSNFYRNHTLTFGREIDWTLTKTKLLPGLIYSKQKEFTHTQVDIRLQHKRLVAGVGCRNGKAYLYKITYLHPKFAIGYACDRSKEIWFDKYIGSHELSLAFNLGNNSLTN